jgi:class 3 adenylate cyclase
VQPAAGATSRGRDGERHHAVIVFADVVGYSRLMADDEPGTLNRWTALYKDVLKPESERLRGQVCELRGDGTLLEFEQVADALEWSRLAHCAAAAAGIGATASLAMRVAIHQGTVFSTREGLFGDAVNIAARLQQHAALRRARRGGARARSMRPCCRLRIRAVTSTSAESRSRTTPAATCRRPFAGRVSAATSIRATRPPCGISSQLPRPERSPAI